jgi:2',3'-cyclic-nucleotide 2'-phosphodiesterase (5'-nucleotidase family)
MTQHLWRISLLFLFVSALGCGGKKYAIQNRNASYVYVHDSLGLVNQKATDYIMPYKLKLDSTMNTVIGYAAIDFVKPKDFMKANGVPESPAGNFIADLVLIETNEILKSKGEPLCDIVLLNTGGIRTALSKGPVTIGNIFEIMPFDNSVVVMELNGQQMVELFDAVAIKGGHPLAGCSMAIRNKHAADIRIAGTPFKPDADRMYRVATSDYLSTGGDQMTFFLGATTAHTLILLRDMIVQHFKRLTTEGKEAFAEADGRVYYDK